MSLIYHYNPPALPEVGLDEVGRGCLAGPVVAAAVILAPTVRIEGLDDSKALNKKKRLYLAEEIKKGAVAWQIGIATPEEIDRHNILQATFLAMHRALDELIAKGINPSLLLIDGNRFKPYKEYDYKTIIKGDSRVASIAAASIIAKTYRDQLMQEEACRYPQYGWERNVGYPTKEHRKAIVEYGSTPLHRRSFKL